MCKSFWEVVAGRVSVREYRDKRVPVRVIKKLISAACSAPSAHNSQPWHFIVITSQVTKRKLAATMAREFVKDMLKASLPEHEAVNKAKRSIRKITDAPVLIVVLKAREKVRTIAADIHFLREKEEQLANQSVAVAAGYLLLAAHASGLGSCWLSAPLYCQDKVREILNFSRTWEPQALITLGYPRCHIRSAKKRLPYHEVTSYLF